MRSYMQTFIPPIMHIVIPEHIIILITQVMEKVAITMMRRTGGNFGKEKVNWSRVLGLEMEMEKINRLKFRLANLYGGV